MPAHPPLSRTGRSALPTPISREDQRRLTRRRIIDAARASFYHDGVSEVSMEQIARAAGIGRATLYLHFPNKDSILLELLLQNLGGVKRIFYELCTLAQVDLPAVQAWLLHYIDTLRAHRDALRLVHVGLATTDAAQGMIHDHHLALADMLSERFPDISDGTARGRTRLLLMIGRIDNFASAAAATPPRLDPEAGVALIGGEFIALIEGRAC
jgi:AcrR family transcriptional regulator